MQKMMTNRPRLLAWLLCALPAAATLADEPIALADFFRNPIVSSPVMSPNSQHVAAALAGGPQARRRLVVLNLEDPSKSKLLAGFGDADVQTVHW